MKRRQHQRAVRTALAAMFWLRQNEREAARLADAGLPDRDADGSGRGLLNRKTGTRTARRGSGRHIA
jgi:hypothetical protein